MLLCRNWLTSPELTRHAAEEICGREVEEDACEGCRAHRLQAAGKGSVQTNAEERNTKVTGAPQVGGMPEILP